MALVLGLNVFTACYGPAMPPEGWKPDEDQEVSEGTKAEGEEVAEVTEEAAAIAENA